MNTTANYRRDNLRFLAFGAAGIAAMATTFLMLSWALGGSYFFDDVLRGGTFLPLLGTLIVAGLAAGFHLRPQDAAKAQPQCDLLETARG